VTRPVRDAGPVGWLFPFDWDAPALARLRAERGLRFATGGFDLFAFPSQLALAGFDHDRFAARQAARGRRQRWRAVLSHGEQFGALAAALVAERLKLPGAAPEAILAAQHKLHARRVLQRVAPEASLDFADTLLVPGAPLPPGLAFPAFVKPVKGSFSVLARPVGGAAELQRHLAFGRAERWLLQRLVAPFDRVCRERLPQAGPAAGMLLERAVPAPVPQYNLDGWVAGGRIHALGVVDAICYPGTRAFMRWEAPSRLPAPVQARALDMARRFLDAVGYRLGFFNLEFFHDPATDRLTVIECNPRLASQFGDLWQRVRGRDPHAMALDLALGEDPLARPAAEPTAAVAASLVYRAFDPGHVPPAPGAAQRAAFARAFPDALLLPVPKGVRGRARDFRWTGNHHFGFVHLGADDHAQLLDRAEQASALLGWPAPCADRAAHPEALPVAASRHGLAAVSGARFATVREAAEPR
jgi:hypothetical protein